MGAEAFSRGAAQARAFLFFLNRLLRPGDGGHTLAGVPFRVQFAGLFDSVASVGLADASPTHRGFGGWANGTQDLADCVERSVHLLAAHELRHAFPSSCMRIGARYPRNSLEMVYPGAHSDLGGGYPPGSQGKAVGGRAELLSQVPLLEMYHQARVSGVPLLSTDEMKAKDMRPTLADLQIAPRTAQLCQSYVKWANVSLASIEDMLRQHTRYYWRWRHQRSTSFERLKSYNRADGQGRQDLWESELDFRADAAAVHRQQAVMDGKQEGKADKAVQALARDYVPETRREQVPPDVDAFFDEMVHDSHATFYMAGPTTDEDARKLIEMVRAKAARGEKLNSLERRIQDHEKAHPGQLPVLTDADTPLLLQTMRYGSRKTMETTGQKTRRETGGHIHYRRIFDKS
ncbi:MAG: DUF2235 domain-containing protein [Variovorax sp.]|nr:MAG: DUF2235 domain-containing protein [Variovorax sp.]